MARERNVLYCLSNEVLASHMIYLKTIILQMKYILRCLTTLNQNHKRFGGLYYNNY